MAFITTYSRTLLELAISLVLSIAFLTTAQAQTIGTIGVGDFRVAPSVKTDAATVDIVGGETTAALAKSRKFALLDNARLKDRLSKQGVSLEGYYAGTNPGNTYAQKGLDFILTGEITELGVYSRKRGSSNQSIGIADIDFRIISVSEGTKGFEGSVSAQASTKDGDEQTALDQAISNAVNQMVAKVLAGAFPIRVMGISEEGAITLNYGNGVLSAGDTIRMYGKADSSKAATLTSGDPIATLQVISTDTKFSTAQALEGADRLTRGAQGELLLSDG